MVKVTFEQTLKLRKISQQISEGKAFEAQKINSVKAITGVCLVQSRNITKINVAGTEAAKG